MLRGDQGMCYPVQEVRSIPPFKPLLFLPTQVSHLFSPKEKGHCTGGVAISKKGTTGIGEGKNVKTHSTYHRFTNQQ